MNVQSAVSERYSKGAKEKQGALCCAVDYDSALLRLLPREIVDKDYGCGDPTRYVRQGDVVLDLGSGSGKVCYIAAQLVGEKGRVIGIDMNNDMLALARKYQSEMADKLGGDRVKFLKGHIQDLALDVEKLDRYLAKHPVVTASDYARAQEWQAEQRTSAPLIANESVDVIISNCVLNLVEDSAKRELVSEISRVLKPGGRVAISDIISDEPIPNHLKADAELWSGCISGAFQEQEMIEAFQEAGFLAVRYDRWATEPWRVVEGIQFRSIILTAVKSLGTECLDRGHAVIYRGPFREVTDDEGHVFPRGERMAVCERTYRFLMEGAYRDDFIGITPDTPREPVPWCAPVGTRRPASETKGGQHTGDRASSACC